MKKLRLGFLISGGGTTFLNIEEQIKQGRLAADVACVISSKSSAAGLEKARNMGYPAEFIGRRRFEDDSAYSRAIIDVLEANNTDLVILAGFLKKFLPGKQYHNRCLNIHPSLIPSFCGKGFYGMKVHEAVWQKGCRVSGCTVHLVDDEYDSGPIVVQKTVALDTQDSPEDIRRKVFEKECEAYPEAINYFIQERIRVENNRVMIT